MTLSATPVAAIDGSVPDVAPRTAPIVLRLEDLSRSFGPVRAVENVSLELRRGEIVTLLGPSGCGKTTTLRMAVGLERSSSGRVVFLGRVIDSAGDGIFVPPNKRNMGMVFQSYAIWPHLTVFENIAYPLRARGIGRPIIRDKVSNVLELVGLSGLENRSGTALSGGQAQRVAVARALVFDPDLLLMDEPFSNLDAKLREQMRADIKLLQRRLGIAVLFVTHDQTEALAISDRIAVMNGGRIEQFGAPAEIYAHPKTGFVRDFLGRTLLLRGRVIAPPSGGRATIRLEDGTVLEVRGGNHGTRVAMGGPCLVAIRPEQMLIDTRAEANNLRAAVRTVLFLGDRYEVLVELPGGAQATISVAASGRWHEGQSLTIHLPPEMLQLWEAPPAG